MNTYVEIRKLGSVAHSSGHNYYTNKEVIIRSFFFQILDMEFQIF